MTTELNDPNDCSAVLMRVFEYIDREMTEEDCNAVRDHLQACGPCMSEYHRDVLIKALVHRSCACEPAPPALRMQIMAQITTISYRVAE